jgi:hypothetical protein
MCVDPVTAISIGSAGLGAASSLMSGSANSQAAGIAAQAARNNAQMALDEGAGRAAQVDLRVNQAVGRTRAAFGGGNIDVNSGSSLADQVMSAQQGNTDKQLILANSLNSSAGQRFAAAQDYRKQGQDQMAGILGAGTALLRAFAGMRGLGGNLGAGFGGFNVAPGFMTGAYGF